MGRRPAPSSPPAPGWGSRRSPSTRRRSGRPGTSGWPTTRCCSGPRRPSESYLAVDRIVEAARRSGVAAVLPVPPALAGNARLAAAVVSAGLTWVGPDAEVLERLGGDGVEPASERGFLAWVTADGLQFTTAGLPRPRRRHRPGLVDAGRRRGAARGRRAGWPTSAGAAWSPSASRRTASSPRWPPGSPSTWRSWSGRTAWTPSSSRCAAPPASAGAGAGGRVPGGRPSSSSCGPTLPPGTPGRVTGRLPGTGPPATSGRRRGGGGRQRLRARGPAGRLVRRAAGHRQRRRPGHGHRRPGRVRGPVRAGRTSACRTTATEVCAVLARLAAGRTRPVRRVTAVLG